MNARLEVTLVFRLHSGIHVTGEQARLWTDKALVRSWHDPKRPILPATTLKGWLREGAERLLRGLKQPACDSSQPGSMCGICLVCEVFGAPRRRSPLRFSDAELRESMADVRTNVSLSRRRKTAYEERVFSVEVAWQKEFETRIKGWFDSPAKAQRAAALLYLGAKGGFAIGAARSRGLGWLKLEAFTASVNGTELRPEELVTQLVSQGESQV